MADYDPAVGTREYTLHSIFITALEGGIGYWAECETYKWNRPEWFAVITEAEDVATPLRIDAAVIRKGIRLWTEHFKDWNSERFIEVRKFLRTNGEEGDLDAGDADAIVQFGLLNELVYG